MREVQPLLKLETFMRASNPSALAITTLLLQLLHLHLLDARQFVVVGLGTKQCRVVDVLKLINLMVKRQFDSYRIKYPSYNSLYS